MKGHSLTKPELKKRLLLMGATLDPLDDNKTTYSHIYDYLIKDKSNIQKIRKIIEQDELNFEPKLVNRKRKREPEKKKIPAKRAKSKQTETKKQTTKAPTRKPKTQAVKKPGRKSTKKVTKQVKKAKPVVIEKTTKHVAKPITKNEPLKKHSNINKPRKANRKGGEKSAEPNKFTVKYSKLNINPYKEDQKVIIFQNVIDPCEELTDEEISNARFTHFLNQKVAELEEHNANNVTIAKDDTKKFFESFIKNPQANENIVKTQKIAQNLFESKPSSDNIGNLRHPFNYLLIF